MSTDTPETKNAPHLVIELNGIEEKFVARRGTPTFLIYKQLNAAKARKQEDQLDAAGVVFEYVKWSIKDPDEFARCQDFLIENSDDEEFDDKLMTALNALWSGETVLPLEQESTDSQESITPTESSLTPNSSEPDTEEPKIKAKKKTSAVSED